jgi:hypothetical protein
MKHDAIRMAMPDAAMHRATPPGPTQCVNGTGADWDIDTIVPGALSGVSTPLRATA